MPLLGILSEFQMNFTSPKTRMIMSDSEGEDRKNAMILAGFVYWRLATIPACECDRRTDFGCIETGEHGVALTTAL